MSYPNGWIDGSSGFISTERGGIEKDYGV